MSRSRSALACLTASCRKRRRSNLGAETLLLSRKFCAVPTSAQFIRPDGWHRVTAKSGGFGRCDLVVTAAPNWGFHSGSGVHEGG